MSNINVPVLRNSSDSLKDRLTDNAYEEILPARYLKKNENGEVIEEQEELFPRVAKNIAVAEAVHVGSDFEWLPEECTHDHFDEGDYGEYLNTDGLPLNEKTARYFSYDGLKNHLDVDSEAYQKMVGVKGQFQDMMEHLKLMPNTPTLMNAGDELQQLAACFTLHPEDDMEHIHNEVKKGALVQQSGGGIGLSFNDLRPYGDTVGSTGGIASGPISFMRTFDQMTDTIRQGGTRRGAMMGMLRIDHPDIPLFIHSKNKDVSLAQTLLLNDPDDFTHNSFGEALEEARELIDENGKIPEHLRNAAEGHLSNFNISVLVDDEFMDCLKNGSEYTLTNPRTEEAHISTEETEEMYSWFGLEEYVNVGEELSIPADILWEHMIEGAHENGEPGVGYIDTVNNEHAFDVDEYPEMEIRECNPCGEIFMSTYDACNLAHINLSTIVDEDIVPWSHFNSTEYETEEEAVEAFLFQAINWNELRRRIETGTRLLDNVVTMSDYPVEEIDETVQSMRRIGLGIMGLAQLYVELGVRYGTEKSAEIARQIMRYINHESKRASRSLSEERGVFNEWDKSKFANPLDYPDWFRKHVGEEPSEWEEGYPLRNMNTTMIAPCGTTGMIGKTVGGCEPIYNVAYYKNVSDDIQGDEMLVEFDNLFLKVLKENDVDVESVKKEAERLMENNRFDGVGSLESVPTEIAEIFVTTNELEPEHHASVQCALQEGVDSSISKTTNAPSDSTVEDAKEIFEYIYENDGKAVTYYRDGSRTKQVQTTRKDNQDVEDEEIEKVTSPLHREAPKIASGTRYEIETGYGDMFVNIVEDEHGPVELIANVGKSGGTVQSMTEAIGRLVSKSLQNGVEPVEIIKQLDNIHSPKKTWDEGDGIESVPDGIAVALERYIEYTNEKEGKEQHPTTQVGEIENDNSEANECLECGARALVVEEGCSVCKPELGGCGYSKCG